jgi:Fic family protein
MTDLVDWYNAAEKEGRLSPVELAALFHYRYIRIHPFEDGNGRIARLMVNFILCRHDYPLIVVRRRKKGEYLEALHQADMAVGPVPADGAHAQLFIENNTTLLYICETGDKKQALRNRLFMLISMARQHQ